MATAARLFPQCGLVLFMYYSCCYSCAMLALFLRYSCVILALFLRYSCVIPLLFWLYSFGYSHGTAPHCLQPRARTGARNQLTEVFSGDATCGGSSLKKRCYRGCGGRVLAVLAICVAWMCARLRLGLARLALPARGCAVPVAPPSATTTQQGEHVLVRVSAGITLRRLGASYPSPSRALLYLRHNRPTTHLFMAQYHPDLIKRRSRVLRRRTRQAALDKPRVHDGQ